MHYIAELSSDEIFSTQIFKTQIVSNVKIPDLRYTIHDGALSAFVAILNYQKSWRLEARCSWLMPECTHVPNTT